MGTMKKLVATLFVFVSLVGVSTPTIVGAASNRYIPTKGLTNTNSIESVMSTQAALARLLMWTNGSTSRYVTIRYIPPILLSGAKHTPDGTTYYGYMDGAGNFYWGDDY